MITVVINTRTTYILSARITSWYHICDISNISFHRCKIVLCIKSVVTWITLKTCSIAVNCVIANARRPSLTQSRYYPGVNILLYM